MRSKKLRIGGECKTVNTNLMKFESVFYLFGLEIPDDDICREARESILGACNIFAIR